jgi:hypothetical protein
VTQRNGVATLAEGEAVPGTEKGGDDASWANTNLSEPKNEENSRDRFSWYKWTVKI